MVVHGELDPLIPLAHARRVAAEAKDATLVEVKGGTHGANNLSYMWAPMINDWLAVNLGGAVT